MNINVLIEISNKKLDRCFTYKVREELIDKIKIGIRVIVPFGKKTLVGFVMETNVEEKDYELKEIIDIVDEFTLNEELLNLGKYISERTISTLISSYQVMLPSGYKAKINNKTKSRKEYFCRINKSNINQKFTIKQLEIINYIKDKELLYSELKNINTSVDTLIKNNVLIKELKEIQRYNIKESNYKIKQLTEDQLKVKNEIVSNINTYSKYLIHGVTGSGKTEVYMEIIDEVLKLNKQAIMLVPEISLTPQIVDRFKGRFKEKIAILHSGLSDGEKYDEYKKILNNEVRIVIGARSAIFAPLSNLGVVIIDECHSETYKQENMPRYDTIDVANYRCKYNNCPIVLGSATPTLEIYARSLKGIYKLLELNKRIGNATLPKINVVDMMKEKRIKNTSFSETLYNSIKSTLERNEQVILLLNRRGYANLVTCTNCSNTIKCPYCDITLTYHKTKELLRCHYCGYAINVPKVCPNCKEEKLKIIGNGTEKVEEEISKLFDNVNVVRMDTDTTSKKGSHEKILEDFGNNKYQILLGTQMISKGLDFPNVTLVGVLNADTSLSIPSFNSPFETYTLLSQVSGRAGRSDKSGNVVIQTYNKDHYVIEAILENDYKKYYQKEMLYRKQCSYPPYYYLVNIIVKSKDYDILTKESNYITMRLKKDLNNVEVLGPTLGYPYKVNNIFRFSITLKYKSENNLYEVLKTLNDYYINNDKLNLEFDFNPINF